MKPHLKLYEPPLDDGEEDETPEIPCIDSDIFHRLFSLGFGALVLIGSLIAALIWRVLDRLVP